MARDSLHPALSDLLIEAAREVHGERQHVAARRRIPCAAAHDFPISDDAARYYKSGKSFLYRILPFWLASLADRLLVVVVPLIVLLIPALRFVPLAVCVACQIAHLPLVRRADRDRTQRAQRALARTERAALIERSMRSKSR